MDRLSGGLSCASLGAPSSSGVEGMVSGDSDSGVRSGLEEVLLLRLPIMERMALPLPPSAIDKGRLRGSEEFELASFDGSSSSFGGSSSSSWPSSFVSSSIVALKGGFEARGDGRRSIDRRFVGSDDFLFDCRFWSPPPMRSSSPGSGEFCRYSHGTSAGWRRKASRPNGSRVLPKEGNGE